MSLNGLFGDDFSTKGLFVCLYGWSHIHGTFRKTRIQSIKLQNLLKIWKHFLESLLLDFRSISEVLGHVTIKFQGCQSRFTIISIPGAKFKNATNGNNI